MKARQAVICIGILIFLTTSGCLLFEKKTIALPHSNQSVELNILTQTKGQSSSISAELKEPKRSIEYQASSWWSSGGGYSESNIKYSDEQIEYRYRDYFGNSGREVNADCIRGNCGFDVFFKQDWMQRYPNAGEIHYAWLSCYSNETYLLKWAMTGTEDKNESKRGSGCPECEIYNLTCIENA